MISSVADETEPRSSAQDDGSDHINRKEQEVETREILMQGMQEYYARKNMNELQRENFYDKLIALKKEQEKHIQLVERVYLLELEQKMVSKREEDPLEYRSRSILKNVGSIEQVCTE